MKLKTKLITLVVAFLAAISFALPSQVNAAKGDQGPDWAKYQGASGRYGTDQDKFVISQIGGTYSGRMIAKLLVPRRQENVCIATSGMVLVQVASWD